VADFDVSEGETIPFVLTYGPSHLPLPEPINPAQALQYTEDFWTEWCSRCTYQGDNRDLVMRSLITLKALTYQPTGGIVAAPTTSLPESSAGARNWDYRFCWLRDATFTLLALNELRLYRGSLRLAQLAITRRGGIAGEHADHVWNHGQRRLLEWEGRLAARLRRRTAGSVGNAAHAAASARRLRRTDRCLSPVARWPR